MIGVRRLTGPAKNPAVGSILGQLYVRQALQHLIPQQQIIKSIDEGYASPTYGPVPVEPPSSFVSPVEKSNPYPFSISSAKQLLASHGWRKGPGGTDVCDRPGSGAGDCGGGVSRGARLAFSLVYPSDQSDKPPQAAAIKSAAALAGITISLRSEPGSSVVSDVTACPPRCGWELGEYGGYYYSGVPLADSLLETGGALNSGHYSNPVNNRNIDAVRHSSSPSAMYAYEDFVAKQLPLIWTPTPEASLTANKTDLHGVVPQNVYGMLTPENWYYTK